MLSLAEPMQALPRRKKDVLGDRDQRHADQLIKNKPDAHEEPESVPFALQREGSTVVPRVGGKPLNVVYPAAWYDATRDLPARAAGR